MKTLEKRIQRIEDALYQDEDLTEGDLTLLLSVLPDDFAESVKDELRRRVLEDDPEIEIKRQEFRKMSRKNKLRKIIDEIPFEESREILIREYKLRGDFRNEDF